MFSLSCLWKTNKVYLMMISLWWKDQQELPALGNWSISRNYLSDKLMAEALVTAAR